MNGVDDPPANPTTLGDVWIGETRPRVGQEGNRTMEPTKIENSGELDLNRAEEAAKTIQALIEGLRFVAPEDAVGSNSRLRDIAVRLDVLTEALKITPPVVNVNAQLERHRAIERRHRDQRGQICALLQMPWEQVTTRVKELLEDARMKVDLIGELRAGAAAVGLDPEMRPVDLAKALTARGPENAQGPYSRLQLIHEELKAAGLTPAGADPWNPIDSVKMLIEERRELLEEMAKSVSQEQIVDALASDPPPQQPVESEKLETVAEFMSGSADAMPDLLPSALQAAHDALVAVITASERDWSRSADLAWIYGVLVGWSEDDLRVLQINFGWREQVIRVIDEHRVALVCAGMAEQ